MSRPTPHAVWIAGAAAIVPMAAISAAQAPAMTGAFNPPAAPLLLTRTLRHQLHDGQAVVTRRAYRVQFVAERGGFRLDGTLADVTVEAPPGLEALAALERKRPDVALFPMQLDAGGQLKTAPEPAASLVQRQAIGVAANQIARMNLATDDAAQAQGFVSQLQTRPYRTAWPRDLFRPAPGDRREQRAISVGDGLQGQVTTEIAASADAASGLLAAFSRKVTTDLGGNTRVVVEEWTLSPAP